MNAAQIESLAVDRACRRLGLDPTPTRKNGEDKQTWRKIALARLGVKPPNKVTHTDVLQLAGKVSGHLYQHETFDDSGRKLRRFYGSSEACWGQFRAPTMKLRRIIKDETDRGNKLMTVCNLNGVPVRTEYSDGRQL